MTEPAEHTPAERLARRGRLAKIIYDTWVKAVDGPAMDVDSELPLISPDDYEAVYACADAIIAAEPDAYPRHVALIGALVEALMLAKREVEHEAPSGCWATGPKTGNFYEDLVVCPGCRALASAASALASAQALAAETGR